MEDRQNETESRRSRSLEEIAVRNQQERQNENEEENLTDWNRRVQEFNKKNKMNLSTPILQNLKLNNAHNYS